MKTQTLSMFTIFALTLLSLSMVSAVSLSAIDPASATIPTEVANDAGTFDVTFDLTNTGALGTLDWSISALIEGTGTFSFSQNDIAVSPVTDTITATITFDAGQTGNIAGTIDVVGQSTQTHRTLDFSVLLVEPATPEGFQFCEESEVGDLRIEDFDVENLDGKDDEWEPLDEIEIRVNIENIGETKITDVFVELRIFDSDDEDVTDDFELDDEEVDLGNIRKDKEDEAVFKIESLPADLEDGTYRIYVKAYEDGLEDENCAHTSRKLNTNDEYHEISIDREDDPAVILKESDITAVEADAGEEVIVSFYVYNVGTDDEDDILVMLENKDLGISEKFHISNLDSGKKKSTEFSFKVPEDAEDKKHSLSVYIYFEYDDGDILDEFSYDSNSFDDLDQTYRIPLKIVEGTANEPTITAILASEANVGEDLIVQVTITNPGDSTDFIVTADGYELWANLVGIEPSIVNVAEDGTGQATITLTPTTSGAKTFSIKTVYSGQTKAQQVSVNIAQPSGFLTGAFAGAGNTGLYVVSAVILVLIILIIILIVKVASSSATAEF